LAYLNKVLGKLALDELKQILEKKKLSTYMCVSTSHIDDVHVCSTWWTIFLKIWSYISNGYKKESQMNINMLKDYKSVISTHKCKATYYQSHLIMSLTKSITWMLQNEKNQWLGKNIKVKTNTRHMELTIGLLNHGALRTYAIITLVAKS
jgi:hypothetical protein